MCVRLFWGEIQYKRNLEGMENLVRGRIFLIMTQVPEEGYDPFPSSNSSSPDLMIKEDILKLKLHYRGSTGDSRVLSLNELA